MDELLRAIEEVDIVLDRDPRPWVRDAVRKLHAAVAKVLQEEVRKNGT